MGHGCAHNNDASAAHSHDCTGECVVEEEEGGGGGDGRVAVVMLLTMFRFCASRGGLASRTNWLRVLL